jgi:hypothetical protein
MSNLTVEAVQVEIKGAKYLVEPIAPGEFGVSAVRLVKLASGIAYDLLRTNDNQLQCDCPDFEVRHADKGTCCKHLAYAVANGLLPIEAGLLPAVPAQKYESSPALVTDLDRKRAAMWGLKLPAVAEPTRAIQIPTIPLAPVFVVEEFPVPAESNPRDSWPAWTDEFAWELGPETEVAESGPTDSWMAESTALLLTGLALGLIEEGETGEALALYDHTEPEFRAAFDTWLLGLESSAVDWSSWLDLCQSGSPVSFPELAPVFEFPTRPRRFAPSLEDEREAAAILNGGLILGTYRRPRFSHSTMPNNDLTDADIYPAGCWS